MDVTKLDGISSIVLTNSDNDEKISKKRKMEASSKSVDIATHTVVQNVESQLLKKKSPPLKDIASIKDKVISGSYEVDYKKIAKKLMVLDKIWY